MIDFDQVWLPQIVGYAKLISSGQLEGEWLGRTKAATSVSDPTELHEQIFDDLDAEEVWAAHNSRPTLSAEASEAVDHFLTALLNLNESDPTALVASEEWGRVKQAAQALAGGI